MIVAKQQELKDQSATNRDSMQDVSSEERREAMEQQRDELAQWAEDNDIPLEYLRSGFGGPGRHGFGGPKK